MQSKVVLLQVSKSAAENMDSLSKSRLKIVLAAATLAALAALAAAATTTTVAKN